MYVSLLCHITSVVIGNNYYKYKTRKILTIDCPSDKIIEVRSYKPPTCHRLKNR